MTWTDHEVTWSVSLAGPPYWWDWTCRCGAADTGHGLDPLNDSVVGHYATTSDEAAAPV